LIEAHPGDNETERRSSLRRTYLDSICPDIDVVNVSEVTVDHRPVASCRDVRSRVITEEESPIDEPKKVSRAGAKSPVESSCR